MASIGQVSGLDNIAAVNSRPPAALAAGDSESSGTTTFQEALDRAGVSETKASAGGLEKVNEPKNDSPDRSVAPLLVAPAAIGGSATVIEKDVKALKRSTHSDKQTGKTEGSNRARLSGNGTEVVSARGAVGQTASESVPHLSVSVAGSVQTGAEPQQAGKNDVPGQTSAAAKGGTASLLDVSALQGTTGRPDGSDTPLSVSDASEVDRVSQPASADAHGAAAPEGSSSDAAAGPVAIAKRDDLELGGAGEGAGRVKPGGSVAGPVQDRKAQGAETHKPESQDASSSRLTPEAAARGLASGRETGVVTDGNASFGAGIVHAALAGAAEPTKLLGAHVSGRFSETSSTLDSSPASTSESGAAGHTGVAVLSSASNALEVGLVSGTHGWVKVRAEIAADGGVDASIVVSASSSTSAGQPGLHERVQDLTNFLAAERTAVSSVVVHQVTSASTSAEGDARGSQPGFESSSNGGSSPHEPTRPERPGSDGLVPHDVSGVNGSAGGLNIASGPQYGGAFEGGWINVRV